MIEVVALLIILKGDVLTLTEMEKFPNMESCAGFARMEYQVVIDMGHSGIGCAIYKDDGSLEMKLIGVMKWRKP